jgi:hypothetical protein
MTSEEHKPHPGQETYPDLKEPLTVKGLGEHESPQIDVRGGLVVFSRWDEDIDDRVSFTMTEWDFHQFMDKYLDRRMDRGTLKDIFKK